MFVFILLIFKRHWLWFTFHYIIEKENQFSLEISVSQELWLLANESIQVFFSTFCSRLIEQPTSRIHIHISRAVNQTARLLTLHINFDTYHHHISHDCNMTCLALLSQIDGRWNLFLTHLGVSESWCNLSTGRGRWNPLCISDICCNAETIQLSSSRCGEHTWLGGSIVLAWEAYWLGYNHRRDRCFKNSQSRLRERFWFYWLALSISSIISESLVIGGWPR